MTDQINQKLNSSFDKEQDRVLVAGMYGYNATSGKFNYANIDDNGDLKVNIHATGGGGDLKARTDIADPATSTFLKCNTDGTLEMTAELSTAGLATSAIQTDGTQKTQILGNTVGDGSGDSKHIHVDANGNVNSQIINTVSTNAFRTVINDGSTNSHALVDSDGHLQVDVLTSGTLNISGDAQIKAEDDTGSARNIRCNNSGHVKSACIGAESDGTLRQIQTNEVGQLKTKLVADDGATRREVRCNATGQLEVAVVSGGGSSTNTYPTVAGITSGQNFGDGAIKSAYIDLSNSKNILVNCIFTGNNTERTNFNQDCSFSLEFTDEDTNTVCYSGASPAFLGQSTLDAEGNSTGVAVARQSLGADPSASGEITGKFCRINVVNNNASGTNTNYAITFKVVLSGI